MRLGDRLDLSVPVVSAPMAGSVGPDLAAAVSGAGGLGGLPVWHLEPAQVTAALQRCRSLTARPVLPNLNMHFPWQPQLQAVLAFGVPAVSLFWGLEPAAIAQVKQAGARVVQTVGSVAQARQAVAMGADVIVAQGWEAGGHVCGEVATLALVPAVVDAVAPVPVIAAGGIADGRGLAAVLALGASAGWIGTLFLASAEAEVHPGYRDRILASGTDDTLWTRDLYCLGWPDAPHRTLRNSTSAGWEAAGRPPLGRRPGEGDVLARDGDAAVLRYQIHSPRPDDAEPVEPLPMWAGQGVGLVRAAEPAASIVRRLDRDARAALARPVW